MVSKQNIEILKKDIQENIGFIRWKPREKPYKIYGIPIDEIDLFMLLFLYFIISFKLAGKNAPGLYRTKYNSIPRMNDIGQIHDFITQFDSDEKFWQRYMPEYKIRYKFFLREIIEYLNIELRNYQGINDLERFYTWIEKVDTVDLEKYGIAYSINAIQAMKRLMGYNVISVNNYTEDYMLAIFDRNFKKHSIVFIFELLAKETNCDLWYISDEIEKFIRKIEVEKRQEWKLSKQNFKAKQHQMILKAKGIISKDRWDEIHSKTYSRRDDKIRKILECAKLDYQEYWGF